VPYDELDAPASADELYLARGAEVSAARPVLTGDVYDHIEVPGFPGDGLAVVITHPCSMRTDGVHLAERLLMAKVSPAEPVALQAWRTGHFRRMPLPDLIDGESHAAPFEQIGTVDSTDLLLENRVASMSTVGVNLLQQRLIFSLTRFKVPTAQLNETSAHVYEEADLLEEWATECAERDVPADEAAEAFHAFIREEDEFGVSYQEKLREPQRRAAVRRESNERCRAFVADR
jgi:hypothetical protein